MSRSSVTVSIEVDGYEDAQRLACAVELLRHFAEEHGNEEVITFTEKARESLSNLHVRTQQHP